MTTTRRPAGVHSEELRRPELAVITLTLDEANNIADLKSALDAIRHEADVDLLTVLVDAGSSDDTVNLAREHGFDVIVELPGSTIPEARNAGARATDADLLAYVDADCRPQPGWLAAAVATLELSDVSIGGWPTIGPPEPSWVQRAWEAHWSTKLADEAVDPDGLVRDAEAHRLVTTRNMVLHRAVFERLGGFDVRLPTGEDSDFSYRAHVMGLPLVGAPTLEVVHLGEPATLRQFFRQQVWHANHDAYDHHASGGSSLGRNAELFTFGFIGAIVLGCALAAGIASQGLWVLTPLSALPLLGVLGLPALRTSLRADELRLWPSLVTLYFAYGLARAIELLGGANRTMSWRVASPTDD